MMIVALTAQGASFFHVRAAYPRSAETVKSSKSSHSQKRCRPPLAAQKSILACSLLEAILRLDSNEGR